MTTKERLEELYRVTLTVKKISVQSQDVGSDWSFKFMADNNETPFTKRIGIDQSSLTDLQLLSRTFMGKPGEIVAFPVSVDIAERDKKVNDTGVVFDSVRLALEPGQSTKTLVGRVFENGGNRSGQAEIAFQVHSTVECLDEKEEEVLKGPIILITQKFAEIGCPEISTKWTSGLPVVDGRLVPIPINADNHKGTAQLSIITDPKSTVTLSVLPARAGNLSKNTIVGSGDVLFTAKKNTSGFAIVITANGRQCGAVFGQNFMFAHDDVALGGTSDMVAPLTAAGTVDTIDLKGFLGANTALRKDSTARTIVGRLDVNTAPAGFYNGNVSAQVAVTACDRMSLFTNGILGGSITVGGKTFTFAALSSKASFGGSIQLTGVPGSTPVAFTGFSASSPDISISNPGRAIGDSGGIQANQEAVTSTGVVSPAQFRANQKSTIGYRLECAITGEKDKNSIATSGMIVEATSQANVKVGLAKIEIDEYTILMPLPIFTNK